MKFLNSKFNVEILMGDYLQLYRTYKNNLLQNNINENDISTIFNFFINKTPIVELEKDFQVFLEYLLKEQQRNNHNFLRSMIAKKHNFFYKVDYPQLQNKISLKNTKLIHEKNIGSKNIFSNKLIANVTEDLLNVRALENAFLRRIDDKSLEGRLFFYLNGIKNYIYKNDAEREEEVNVRDYFALQLARAELVVLNSWNLFAQELEDSEMNVFDYIFFKYLYNRSVLLQFHVFKEKLSNFMYTSHIEYLYENNTPYNFCLNEFNTIRFSSFASYSDFEKTFSPEETLILEKVFITLGYSNSFLFLTEAPISQSLQKKIDNFLREEWDYLCMASALRTLLVPKDSYLTFSDYFSGQLNSEDWERTQTLKLLFEQSQKFETEIHVYSKKWVILKFRTLLKNILEKKKQSQ